MTFSRREYLLGAGLALAGCSTNSTPRENTTETSTTRQRGAASSSDRTATPFADDQFVLDHTVTRDGTGDFDDLTAAYRAADAGDVIGVGEGQYTLASVTTTEQSPVGPYATVETDEITLVGRSTGRTTVTIDTDERVLALPAWQFWRLSLDAGDTVVGPRANTLRACRVRSPIMDAPGFGGRSHRFGDGWQFTTTGLERTESAARTYHGIAFDRVLDGVADLGFDDTGEEPIDEAFAAAYESGTLIELPPGEYRIDTEHVGSHVSRFGLRGLGESRRDVQITPTKGAALKWLKAVGAGPHLIENLSFQERSDDRTQLSLWLTTTDGSVLKNVEWLGRTPSDDGTEYSLTAEVTDVDGVFVVDGVYAGLDEPAATVAYPNGVAFVRSGPTHVGELVLRRAVIHERNSAATRSTASTGVLTIQGGEFVNNQNANVRFGAGDHPSKVSSATGTYIRVDGSRNSADAIRLNGGTREYSGAVFRDIHVDWTRDQGRAVIALPAFSPHGSATFRDCVIRNDGADTPTVAAHPSSVPDPGVVFENCIFTGSGGGFHAIDRPGSVIRDSCIDMPNVTIQGFDTENVSDGGCPPVRERALPSPTITVHKRAGTTVVLSAVDVHPTPAAVRWDLDGTTTTDETFSYTFEQAGTYSVTLTVESEDGARASTTAELLVNHPALV